jgi:hypothetical protein
MSVGRSPEQGIQSLGQDTPATPDGRCGQENVENLDDQLRIAILLHVD